VTAPRRRALGQHFLADAGVAARIVDAVGPTARDVVCEIGAGPGALTGLLAPRAGRLVALELDRRLHGALAAKAASWPGVETRLADARTFDYAALRDARPAPDGRVLVVGNLPYSASKPILLRLWEARGALDAATVMVQREVAERLVAPPGGKAYGALSVLWQAWADLALLFLVPPGAFRPPPAVESAVVHAAFRAEPRVPLDHPAGFVRLVKAAFAQRRKTLANTLRAGFPALGAAAVEARLAAAGIDGRRRAETLSLEEFARLSRIFVPPEAA
jgi:16S rRNA (adenine1518-N6/adenine1519-N6)-dimethyltransferase